MTPQEWNPSLPYNPLNGCMMQSSFGGSDTGATKHSNYSITTQGKRNQNKINGQRKPFFATPFSWKYVMDGNIRGANKTKYVDIFTCSKRDTCWPPRGLSQNGFRQLDIIVPKTQHNHCMQRTRLLKNFIHSSIRVLPCLHCRSEKGKP